MDRNEKFRDRAAEDMYRLLEDIQDEEWEKEDRMSHQTSQTLTIDHAVGTITSEVWYMTDATYIILYRKGIYRQAQRGEQVIVVRQYEPDGSYIITLVETPIGETLYVRPEDV